MATRAMVTMISVEGSVREFRVESESLGFKRWRGRSRVRANVKTRERRARVRVKERLRVVE